ncbi:rootletin-like [Hippocampus comes]|uniref:rootletin-like n=1 Tax=Hippocampus comes TaxID=109280 RepID=UPI00094F30CE|nr:PREDICTED: rootletin-like [Hippocampus comes]
MTLASQGGTWRANTTTTTRRGGGGSGLGAELRQEVRLLQEELAESRAQREELASRARALGERLEQSVSPSLSRTHREEVEEEERRERRRRDREAREREARQALLVHRLQNKVMEYRERCQSLELELKAGHSQLMSTQMSIGRDTSESLECALISLEEEQQRASGLAQTTSVLRLQLSQSERANEILTERVRKLTADLTRALEEAERRTFHWQRERECVSSEVSQHQDQLWCVWRCVMSLRQHCRALRTAADRDLLEMRTELSRLSLSLQSSCDSTSLHLIKMYRLPAPPTLRG